MDWQAQVLNDITISHKYMNFPLFSLSADNMSLSSVSETRSLSFAIILGR
jgi:hypothetical protein